MVEALSNEPGDNGPGQDIELGKGDQTTSTTVSAISSSFLTVVTNFLGNALERAKNAIKRTFTVISKVHAKGFTLVLTIAGKVISSVVKAIGPLINAIGIFLKEKLGIDLEKLFQWLGLTWDNEKTKANQAVCYFLKSNIGVTGLSLGTPPQAKQAI